MCGCLPFHAHATTQTGAPQHGRPGYRRSWAASGGLAGFEPAGYTWVMDNTNKTNTTAPAGSAAGSAAVSAAGSAAGSTAGSAGSADAAFLDRVERTAREAAKLAGDIALRYLDESYPEEKGDSNNLVTRADIEAQQAIAEHIRNVFPDHAFLGEEGELGSGRNVQTAEHLWVVDPIDGTNNYAHGIPCFAVSIAYLRDGVTQCGVVFDPSRNELFSARRGAGAFLNGRPLRVSSSTGIEGAIVATGFAYERGEYVRRTLQTVQALFDHKLRGIRRFGAAALDLCWVAAGRLDGYFELKLQPWDFAAGALLVEEAGGRVSDAEGRPLCMSSPAVVASAAGMHQGFLEIIGSER